MDKQISTSKTAWALCDLNIHWVVGNSLKNRINVRSVSCPGQLSGAPDQETVAGIQLHFLFQKWSPLDDSLQWLMWFPVYDGRPFIINILDNLTAQEVFLSVKFNYYDTYVQCFVSLSNIVFVYLYRLALLVWEQRSHICPVQAEGFPAANRFSDPQPSNIWCLHFCVWILQRNHRDLQCLSGWWIHNKMDLDLPGRF